VPGEPWAPALSDVARHIPTRTRDTATPGSDRLLNTFTPTTTPTDAQAQQFIDDAVAAVQAAVTGEIPGSGDLAVAARGAAEWQAAADIELAYPYRDADVQVAGQLQARANFALTELRTALDVIGAGVVEALPEWRMPLPAPWGDTSPGTGADYQMGPY